MSQTDDYDYDAYKESLEKILSLSEKDYWAQYVDINTHQVTVSKTYLWVSAALIGAYATAYEHYSGIVFGSACSITIAIICFVSGVIAFGLCLYAIPARQGYQSIPKQSWGDFSEKANQLLTAKESHIYITLLTDMIDRVDHATYHNISTNQKRAKLLRTTSWILLFSLAFSLLTIISSLSNHYINTTKPEIKIVSDNKGKLDDKSPKKTGANVPTPAGPIPNKSDITTKDGHRITSSDNRLTESTSDSHKTDDDK